MGDLQFPVFVKLKDCGDVRSFGSLDAMQNWMEPIDVENGEYEAWDRVGVPLRLAVRQAAAWLIVEPSGASQPDQLRVAIAEYARVNNVQADNSALDRGDFSGALQQISAAIFEKRKGESWWQRLKRRF